MLYYYFLRVFLILELVTNLHLGYFLLVIEYAIATACFEDLYSPFLYFSKFFLIDSFK